MDNQSPPPIVAGRAEPGAESATRVRWRIVGLLMALCFISHLNRVGISIAADERIMPQYGISPTRMGMVYSAFLLVYTFCMIPGGFFIDRFGPRLALTCMGFGSAMFGSLTGVVGLMITTAGPLWISLIVVRSVMGFFTTPLHPACARMTANWIPLPQRAWANGLVTGAALLGIASTYKIFGALIDWVDWPRAFLITGAVTVLLTLIWASYATDHPSQHRRSNPAERQLVENRQLPEIHDTVAVPSRWISIRSLILLTVSYAAVGYFQYLFFYWIHYYFDKVLHFGQSESRWYATLPVLAMAVCMPLGGTLSDRLERKLGLRLGRKVVPIAGMIFSATFLIGGLVAKNPPWIVAFFTLSLGLLGTAEGPFWQTAVQLGGRYGGTAAAFMNTGGNGVGLLAPMLTPAISEALGWAWGISLGALVSVIGALCWCWIDIPENSLETKPFGVPPGP